MKDLLLALHLAWRLLSHSANRFARFVTWVSFAGLTLGVMILTVVVTVMNGFDYELKKRLLSAVPHITTDIELQHDLTGTEADLPSEVMSSMRFFRGIGALNLNGRLHPISMYGMPGAAWRTAGVNMLDVPEDVLGRLADTSTGILIGQPLARAMGVVPGDEVSVMTIEVDGQRVRPRSLVFTLQGVFELGAEPDYGLSMVNLDRFESARWQQMGEIGMQVQLYDPLSVERVLAELEAAYPGTSFASWQSEYGELFQAVQLEKSMMFVLLLLVVAIASFNIIAGQTMLVNDKRRSIAILLTMGAEQGLMRNAFLLQGAVISVSGTAIGLLLGLVAAFYVNELLAALQQVTGMHLLDGSFFVQVPTRVLGSDIAIISMMSCGLCLLSATVPARRAARLDPVLALH